MDSCQILILGDSEQIGHPLECFLLFGLLELKNQHLLDDATLLIRRLNLLNCSFEALGTFGVVLWLDDVICHHFVHKICVEFLLFNRSFICWVEALFEFAVGVFCESI